MEGARVSLASLLERAQRSPGGGSTQKNAVDALLQCLSEWRPSSASRGEEQLDDATLERLGSLVCRVVRAAIKRKQHPTRESWMGAVKQYCGSLKWVCAQPELSVVWEQGSLQAIVGSLVALREWIGGTVAPLVLRCLSRVLLERGNLLGKDLQDHVMTLALPAAVFRPPVVATASPLGDANNALWDESFAEDSKDSACIAPSNNPAPLPRLSASAVTLFDECGAALLCINAIFCKVKRKSHFMDTYLKRISRIALENMRPLISSLSLGAGRTFSCNLALLESVIGYGSLSAVLYQSQVPALLALLAPLLSLSPQHGTSQKQQQQQQQQPTRQKSGQGRDETITILVTTDDTDTSMASHSRILERIRVHILLVLLALVGNAYKLFIQELSLFLPYNHSRTLTPASTFATPLSRHSSSSSLSGSLYALIIYDPSQRVRMHAITLLSGILKSGKRTFGVAQEAESSSFISLSFKMALTLRDLHLLVSIALNSEEDEANKVRLLQLVPLLAAVTPYERLQSPIPEAPWLAPLDRVEEDTLPLLPLLRWLFLHRKFGTIGNVLRALRCYVREVHYWMWRDNIISSFQADLVKDASASAGQRQHQQGEEEEADEVLVACLVDICSHYPMVVRDAMMSGGLLERLLAFPSESALLCVCSFGLHDGSAVLWQRILRGSWERPCSPAKVSLFSSIPEVAWCELSGSMQITVITAVTGASEDDRETVRAASVRGVGHLLMLNALTTSSFRFLMDADALLRRAVSSPASASSAMWGLANLAHALVEAARACQGEPEVVDDIRGMMESLLALSSTGVDSRDEKLVCSCLRIMGKAAWLVEPCNFQPHVERCMAQLMRALDANQPPKVRWNAANALGSVMRSPAAPLFSEKRDQLQGLGRVLVSILLTSGNFKERTSALAVFEALPFSIVLPSEELAMALIRTSLVHQATGGKELDLARQYEARCGMLLQQTLSQVQEREPFCIKVKALLQESPHNVYAVSNLLSRTDVEWLIPAVAAAEESRGGGK